MTKTATPTTTTPEIEPEIEKAGCAQIIEKCTGELLRLAEQQRTLETGIASDTAELAAIADAMNQRLTSLADAHKILAGIEQETGLARNYAQHALQTLNEGTAIQHLADLERSLALQRASVAELETKTGEEQAHDTERAGVCRENINRARASLSDIDRKRYSAEQAIEQAKREHGALLYWEVSARIEAFQADVDRKKHEVVEAQLQLEEYLRTDGLAQLSDYSEHRRKCLDMLSVEDALTLCFSAELAYIDTLLDKGRDLPNRPLNIPAATHYPVWRALLAVPDNEVWNYETLGGDPRMLRRRRQVISEALAQWTARLRQQQK